MSNKDYCSLNIEKRPYLKPLTMHDIAHETIEKVKKENPTFDDDMTVVCATILTLKCLIEVMEQTMKEMTISFEYIKQGGNDE